MSPKECHQPCWRESLAICISESMTRWSSTSYTPHRSRTSRWLMLRRPFSRRLIFDCDTSRRSATSSAVMPLSSRSLRSSWPNRRRLTVGLTLDATDVHLRLRAFRCSAWFFVPHGSAYGAYLLFSRLPPRGVPPLGNGGCARHAHARRTCLL